MTSPEGLRMYFATEHPDGAWGAGRQILPITESPRAWDQASDTHRIARSIVAGSADAHVLSKTEYEDGLSGPGALVRDYWEVRIPNDPTTNEQPLCIDKISENLNDLQARYRALGTALQQHFQRTDLTIFVR